MKNSMEKMEKNLRIGYVITPLSILAQLLLFVYMAFFWDHRIAGLGLMLFSASILSIAFSVPSLALPTGRRLLLLVGFLVFPISIFVTLHVRKLSKNLLMERGYKVYPFRVVKE